MRNKGMYAKFLKLNLLEQTLFIIIYIIVIPAAVLTVFTLLIFIIFWGIICLSIYWFVITVIGILDRVSKNKQIDFSFDKLLDVFKRG